MTKYRRGDIVLVDFVFSQGGGSKKRPALIISQDAYPRSRQEVIVAAVTSNVERGLFGDTVVEDWEEAGLLYPSVVTGILRTIKREMIARVLGKLGTDDFRRVEFNLRKAMGF
jgi:mRNA interferase MazF